MRVGRIAVAVFFGLLTNSRSALTEIVGIPAGITTIPHQICLYFNILNEKYDDIPGTIYSPIIFANTVQFDPVRASALTQNQRNN